MYPTVIALSLILGSDSPVMERTSDYVHGFYVGTIYSGEPGIKDSYLFYKKNGKRVQLFKIGSRSAEVNERDRIHIRGNFFVIQLPHHTGSILNFIFERIPKFGFIPSFKGKINNIFSQNYALSFPKYVVGHAAKYDDALSPPFTHFIYQISAEEAVLKKVRSTIETFKISRVSGSSVKVNTIDVATKESQSSVIRVPLTSDGAYWKIPFQPD